MQETWLEQFYNEMDAEKRLDILNTNADKTVNASEMANHSAENPEEVDVAFIKKLWVARYGKRKPKTDAFVGYLMQLKYIGRAGQMISVDRSASRQLRPSPDCACLMQTSGRKPNRKSCCLR